MAHRFSGTQRHPEKLGMTEELDRSIADGSVNADLVLGDEVHCSFWAHGSIQHAFGGVVA